MQYGIGIARHMSEIPGLLAAQGILTATPLQCRFPLAKEGN